MAFEPHRALARRFLLGGVAFLLAPAITLAADPFAGHWEGQIAVPGREMGVILDLQHDAEHGWQGQASLPDLHVRAARLAEFSIDGPNLKFVLADVLGHPTAGKAGFEARIDQGALRGDFLQAGHRAAFTASQAGMAQIDPPRISNPVPAELEGRWVGKFEGLVDYPLDVAVTLRNEKSVTTAEFVVVGKKTTHLPVAFVTFGHGVLRIESPTTRFHLEGTFNPDSDRVVGNLEYGAFEFPIVLERRGAKS